MAQGPYKILVILHYPEAKACRLGSGFLIVNEVNGRPYVLNTDTVGWHYKTKKISWENAYRTILAGQEPIRV